MGYRIGRGIEFLFLIGLEKKILETVFYFILKNLGNK